MDLELEEHSIDSAYALRELALGGPLAPDELDALATICLEVTYTPRQSVFFAGDEADSFFVVRRGVASVSKSLADGRRQVTGFLLYRRLVWPRSRRSSCP